MRSLRSQQIAGLGFERVVRDAPVATAVIDASGRVIYSNGRARELTGRQLGCAMPPDLDGAIDIFHPDGRRYERHEWPAVRSITSGEDIVEEEFFYALPEGGRLFIRGSSSPLRDRAGEMVAAVLAMVDVTERRRVAEQLAHHASLLDIVEDAVLGTDAAFRLTVWNRGAERLYGYAAEEVLGRDAREFASPDRDASRLEVDRELFGGDRTRAELTAYRKDGTPVEVELIALAVRDEHGEITGYVHRAMAAAQALVLSASLDPLQIARAIDSGAAATLDRTAELDELVDSVRRLHHGAVPPPYGR